MAAVEVAWPRPVVAPVDDDGPSRWRFSGRWWSRPLPNPPRPPVAPRSPPPVPPVLAPIGRGEREISGVRTPGDRANAGDENSMSREPIGVVSPYPRRDARRPRVHARRGAPGVPRLVGVVPVHVRGRGAGPVGRAGPGRVVGARAGRPRQPGLPHHRALPPARAARSTARRGPSTSDGPCTRPDANLAIAARGRDEVAALGEDPVSAVRERAASALAAVETAPAGAVCVTAVGTLSLGDYLGTRVVELTVHTLDLAAAGRAHDRRAARVGRVRVADRADGHGGPAVVVGAAAGAHRAGHAAPGLQRLPLTGPMSSQRAPGRLLRAGRLQRGPWS